MEFGSDTHCVLHVMTGDKVIKWHKIPKGHLETIALTDDEKEGTIQSFYSYKVRKKLLWMIFLNC